MVLKLRNVGFFFYRNSDLIQKCITAKSKSKIILLFLFLYRVTGCIADNILLVWVISLCVVLKKISLNMKNTKTYSKSYIQIECINNCVLPF